MLTDEQVEKILIATHAEIDGDVYDVVLTESDDNCDLLLDHQMHCGQIIELVIPKSNIQAGIILADGNWLGKDEDGEEVEAKFLKLTPLF